MSKVGHHRDTKDEKKGVLPETKTGESGTAKRNIVRKGGKSKVRKENTIGKELDDGQFENGVLDRGDPNYDSENDVPKRLLYISSDSSMGTSKINLPDYKLLIGPLIQEYFISGDIGEVLLRLQEIDAKEYSYEFIKKVINISFDKSDRERELVSRLLSEGYPNVFSTNIIGKGFERLFETIDEILKDAPSAKDMLTKYLARAVIDEVLPPSYLLDPVIVNLGGEIVEQAKRMLSRDHAGAILEHNWGPGDGRPVEELKILVDQLIMEYLISGDMDEALHCAKELQAPQFFHEIVKRAIVSSLDQSHEKQLAISLFLSRLYQAGFLTRIQATKGFDRLNLAMNDIVLDTPAAFTIIHQFALRAIKDDILNPSYEISQLNYENVTTDKN